MKKNNLTKMAPPWHPITKIHPLKKKMKRKKLASIRKKKMQNHSKISYNKTGGIRKEESL